VKSLSEFIIRIIELFEAEARLARRSTVRMFAAVIIWGVSAACILIGILLLASGLYFTLAPVLGIAATLSIEGALFIIISLIALIIGKGMLEMGKD
jgi:hypothetical protein